MIPTPTPDPSDFKIHPGIWGAFGAGIVYAGKIGVALVRSRFDKKDKSDKYADALQQILLNVAEVKGSMATREDVQLVATKIDNHIAAHAEGKFNGGHP